MISRCSRLFSRSRYNIAVNFSYSACSGAMVGTTRGESVYLKPFVAGRWQIWLKLLISLPTFHRREKPHQATPGNLVADAAVQWKINGNGDEEEPKCN